MNGHKHLGVTLDSKLTFVNQISEKLFSFRKGLVSSSIFPVPVKTLDQIYKMYVPVKILDQIYKMYVP